jgi:excisionase family DNA binding protein
MKEFQIIEGLEFQYMNVKTISTYLGVAKSTIYKWVGSGFIPHKKLGKHVLFVKEHIDEWVLNNGEIVNDLPEISRYPEKGDDGMEESHRNISYKERPYISKYRIAS